MKETGTKRAYEVICEKIKHHGSVKVLTWLEGSFQGRKFLVEDKEAPIELGRKLGNQNTSVFEALSSLKNHNEQWEKVAAWCYRCGENVAFIEDIQDKSRLFVMGAGHVSHALGHVLGLMDFDVIVNDPRKEFASAKRFPQVKEMLHLSYEDFFGQYEEKVSDWFVLVTPGHEADFLCAREVLTRKNAYVGMIGSHAKVAATKNKLQQAGIPKERVNELHAPIGLAIGAQTPGEIAISIAAQLIAVRRSKERCILEGSVQVALRHLFQHPEPAMMVTIVWKRGSGPRGEGTRMLVNAKGRSLAGTIGGGAVEHMAMEEAAKMLLEEERFCLREYKLSNAQAASLGMICGGEVRCMFERLDFEM